MFLDIFFALISAFLLGSFFREEWTLVWVLVAIFFVLLPDADGVWEYLERGKIWGKKWSRHRISFFHYPLFYLPIFFVLYFFIPFSYWILAITNLSFHFLHDFRDGEMGIRFFYPFLEFFYALHKKNKRWVIVKRTDREIACWLKEFGNEHWIKDYFKKYWFFRFLGILIVSIGVYLINHGYYPLTSADLSEVYYKFQRNPSSEEKINATNPHSNNQNNNTLITEPGVNDNINNNQKAAFETSVPAETNDFNDNTNNNATPSPREDRETAIISDFVNNHTPFVSQAPLAKWDHLHEEACEETSLLIGHYYLSGKENVSPKDAEKDIQELSDYTKNIYPKKEDMSLEELKKVAKDKYSYNNWRIMENPSVSDIQKELFKGNNVIMPLAGREIGNPNFKQPGPLYHMLVVSGFDKKKGVFITQDPGTRKGKNYEYKFDVLLKAIHDFPGDKNKINQGPARVLVVVK